MKKGTFSVAVSLDAVFEISKSHFAQPSLTFPLKFSAQCLKTVIQAVHIILLPTSTHFVPTSAAAATFNAYHLCGFRPGRSGL